MIGEVKKRSSRRPFFTLKQHGNKWPKQNESRRNFCTINSSAVGDPVANRPIANLIVILNKTQKAMLVNILHRAPMHPVPVPRKDPVVVERFFECLCKLRQRAEICVVAGKFF